MTNRADGVRVAYPLFQAEGGGSTPTSALQLRVGEIQFSLAKKLNRLWHSRLPLLTSPQCRVSYAAEFDGIYYVAAVWSRPMAMANPQYEWLELQRYAIAPDAPKNTASRVLSVMTRLIRTRFPEITRLISYQDTESHSGSIYKAAGWTPTLGTKFTDWTNSKRVRAVAQSTAPKQRWEKTIKRENA